MTEDIDTLEKRVRACARRAMSKAFSVPPFDGSEGSRWIQQKAMRDIGDLGCRVSLTRDTGHVRGKIFDSPDLERCLHFTICNGGIVMKFPGPLTEYDPRVETLFLRQIFGDEELPNLWLDVGRDRDEKGVERIVRHWRLFTDANWIGHDVRDVGARELEALGWKRGAVLHGENAPL